MLYNWVASNVMKLLELACDNISDCIEARPTVLFRTTTWPMQPYPISFLGLLEIMVQITEY
jgi:hypothetical protein